MILKVTKEQVDEIFAEANEQQDYIIALYKLVYPDWDEITKVDGWPRAGNALRVYIAEQAHEWDKEHLAGVLPGGAWILNYGWGSANEDEVLGDWEVTTEGVEVIRFNPHKAEYIPVAGRRGRLTHRKALGG